MQRFLSCSHLGSESLNRYNLPRACFHPRIYSCLPYHGPGLVSHILGYGEVPCFLVNHHIWSVKVPLIEPGSACLEIPTEMKSGPLNSGGPISLKNEDSGAGEIA